MKTKVDGRAPAWALGRPGAGLTLWAVLAMLMVTASPAGAHPEAVLEGDRTSVDAGGTVALRGAEFGDGGTFALRLLGAFDEYDLGEAKPDSEGRFQLDVTIPDDVRPGAYQVVAIAPDGDVAGRFDLTVSAARAMSTEAQTDMGGAGVEDHQATADEISIERDRSGIEWAVIGLIVGVAGGLGVGLGRRQRAA